MQNFTKKERKIKNCHANNEGFAAQPTESNFTVGSGLDCKIYEISLHITVFFGALYLTNFSF